MTKEVTTTGIQVSNPSNDIVQFTDEQLDLIVQASASTGVSSKGEALMIFQKAKELGIGAGNAISHMHVVNGKSGVDVHILKAILSRPSAGVEWEVIEDYAPIYNYTDGTNTFTTETLPSNFVVLTKLKGNPRVDELTDMGKHPVALLPTVRTIGGKQVRVIEPVDFISTYEFTRIKRNIKGEWTTKVIRSSFRWSEALRAQLPLDKAGQINPNSNWSKYPKLMLGIRAFTFGARDIADDLILGCYETTELYDFNNIPYEVTEEGTTTIIGVDKQ